MNGQDKSIIQNIPRDYSYFKVNFTKIIPNKEKLRILDL